MCSAPSGKLEFRPSLFSTWTLYDFLLSYVSINLHFGWSLSPWTQGPNGLIQVSTLPWQLKVQRVHPWHLTHSPTSDKIPQPTPWWSWLSAELMFALAHALSAWWARSKPASAKLSHLIDFYAQSEVCVECLRRPWRMVNPLVKWLWFLKTWTWLDAWQMLWQNQSLDADKSKARPWLTSNLYLASGDNERMKKGWQFYFVNVERCSFHQERNGSARTANRFGPWWRLPMLTTTAYSNAAKVSAVIPEKFSTSADKLD